MTKIELLDVSLDMADEAALGACSVWRMEGDRRTHFPLALFNDLCSDWDRDKEPDLLIDISHRRVI